MAYAPNHQFDPKPNNYAVLKLRDFVCRGSLKRERRTWRWRSEDTAKKRSYVYWESLEVNLAALDDRKGFI
jgi:hypothetical protein